MNNFVVVEDVKYRIGTVLTEAQSVPARLRGAALLPIGFVACARTAIGGYSVRHWGAGERVDAGLPSMVCPMAIELIRGMNTLNWIARIVGKPEDKEPLHGSLRMISDGLQTTMRCPMSAHGGKNLVDLRRLGEQDGSGWLIGGSTGIEVERDGVYGFGLHGAATGVSVLWSAISQSE